MCPRHRPCEHTAAIVATDDPSLSHPLSSLLLIVCRWWSGRRHEPVKHENCCPVVRTRTLCILRAYMRVFLDVQKPRRPSCCLRSIFMGWILLQRNSLRCTPLSYMTGLSSGGVNERVSVHRVPERNDRECKCHTAELRTEKWVWPSTAADTLDV